MIFWNETKTFPPPKRDSWESYLPFLSLAGSSKESWRKTVNSKSQIGNLRGKDNTVPGNEPGSEDNCLYSAILKSLISSVRTQTAACLPPSPRSTSLTQEADKSIPCWWQAVLSGQNIQCPSVLFHTLRSDGVVRKFGPVCVSPAFTASQLCCLLSLVQPPRSLLPHL